MENKAISNTGPIIHLSEIDLTNSLNIFNQILIPPEVSEEIKRNKFQIPEKIKLKLLEAKWKDFTKILTDEFSLDLGESEGIALALQEKAAYFLTDDLDARDVANKYNIEVHGTIGIILRAFREKIIDRQLAIEKINQLYFNSSLHITRILIEDMIKEIEKFGKK